ncbi:uncharacterized protein A1O5_06275 [Cladophialophora psammophila CBS 110553]|uniref:Major facilitator superfamily (MFS) profile domain-containing protein n=1 Tax=Cladophialophora psammophila CBS 110553 TaxID=1182543 RepID=W9WPT9_9EURO|nr:uncharacterized protein A1O5_06275 [Cladophialophora psammophila CBS 110553]EXJ70207.1 hypothetical protein A1O5_06275 [Cladophialophora psammophila CBS 110553]
MAYTLEEGTNRQHVFTAYIGFMLLILGSGSISYGYTAAIIGTTLGQPSFINYFDLATRSNASALIGSLNGVFQAGGVIGTLLLPMIADRYGRRMACIVPSIIIIIISQALLAGSVDVAMFIVFRLFAGFGCYATAAIVPLMMSEIVPPRFRGACVDVMGVGLNVGYATAGWLGYGFSFWNGKGSGNAWHVPLALGCFFPLVFLTGISFLPESPSWLCMKGCENEAEEVLKCLHKHHSDPAGDLARAEFFQVREQLELDSRLDNSWYRLFTKPSYRKRAGLAMLTMFTTQTSGVLLITNYAPLIFSTMGLDTHGQLLILALLVTIGIVENALAMLLVDRFPRPKYMAVGMMGCVAAFATEAGLVAQYAGSNNGNALRAGIAMMFVFGVFYSFGIDGPQFCYLTEIFPSHLRAKGVSLGVATFSLTNIIWLQAAPTAFANIGWKFYLCLVIPSFFLALIMWFCYPDTRGKPLEEIAAVFGDDDEVAVRQADVEIDMVTHEIHAKGGRAALTIEDTSAVHYDGEK